MKRDALQLFVRGFETQENSDKIVRVLQDIGFEIKEKFDGTQDTLGGLIETYITQFDHLACDSLDEIRQAVYRVSDVETFIQYRSWDCAWDEADDQDGADKDEASGLALLKSNDEVDEAEPLSEDQKKDLENRLKDLNEKIQETKDEIAGYEDVIQEHQDEIDEQDGYKTDAESLLDELKEERAEVCRQLGIELPEDDEE